jgi:hypothetical protein
VTSLTSRYRCQKGHANGGWPLIGADREAVELLQKGQCPVCAVDELRPVESALSGLHESVCGCCGSTWRWNDQELVFLPGQNVSITA